MEEVFNRFPAAVPLLATSRWRLTHRVIVWQGLLRQACLSRCTGFGFPIKQFSLSVSFCYPCQQSSTVPTAAMETVCVFVFDTTRLVMSEWRYNVYSFYLPSKLLASALVETFLSCYLCYHVLSVPQTPSVWVKMTGLIRWMLLDVSGVAVLSKAHLIHPIEESQAGSELVEIEFLTMSFLWTNFNFSKPFHWVSW